MFVNDTRKDIKDVHARELDGCRRSFEAGNVAGLMSALSWCLRRKLSPPLWVIEAAYVLLLRALNNEWPRKPGRIASPNAQARQYLIDVTRRDTVLLIRRKQQEVREQVEELRSDDDSPADYLQEREALLRWLGRSWLDAYVCASEDLRGTAAFGSPETMKRSYIRVERESRDPVKALRYRVPDFQALRDLGLETLSQQKWGRKPPELTRLPWLR